MPFIFERFRQVDSSTTRKYGGLGLGLAIVRHLVELHGGSVSADSPGEGGGALFTVDLPVRAQSHERLESSPAEESVAASMPATSLTLLFGVKVLVVDDDDDSRVLLQTALERVGAFVYHATGAAAAFELLQTEPVDVMISDIGMPEEDGLSLMKRLRSLPRHRRLQAVALTAYARSEDVTSALEARFQRHFTKPADLSELAQTLAELVEQAGAALAP